MKKLLSASLLSLGLAVSASASAQETYTTKEVCQEFARLAEGFAQVRDDFPKLTKSDFYKMVRQDTDSFWYKYRLAAVDSIYEFPKLTPQEEGNHVHAVCLDFYE